MMRVFVVTLFTSTLVFFMSVDKNSYIYYNDGYMVLLDRAGFGQRIVVSLALGAGYAALNLSILWVLSRFWRRLSK